MIRASGIRVAVAGLLVIAGVEGARAVDLDTGAAVYDLSLDPTSPPSAITGISGQMKLGITLSCRTYTYVSNIGSELTFEGGAAGFTVYGSVEESPESMRFDMTSEVGGRVLDRAKGIASRTATGISVALDDPAAEVPLAFSGSILFPVEMVKVMVKDAAAGKTFAEYTMYEGSGHGRELLRISMVVGPADKAVDADDQATAERFGLRNRQRWLFNLAYYPNAGSVGDQTPAITTKLVVYDNGFTLGGTYEISGFVMRLRLRDYQAIPPTPCP